MEEPTAEPLQAAVPTEQPPCTTYISLNPFSVAKKLTTTICPSRAVTTAVSSVIPVSTAVTTAVSSVIPVSTVNTPTVAVVSSTTSVQSSVTAAVDASSTSKRVNTMWLNPPPIIAKISSTNTAYTAREDRLILEFASKNLTEVGGKKIWKRLQDSGAIPNRTYESLRTRYHRYLKKN